MPKEKYAIYRSSAGLYAKEYIETMEEAAKLPYSRYIEKSDLPLVVNSVGGRTSFDKNDKRFVEIREAEKGQPPLTREEMYPKNNPNFEYGWISTEGDTYSTEVRDHYDSAEMICEELGYGSFMAERTLEKKGWIKVTSSMHRGVDKKMIYAEDLFITKKQADKLFELGLWETSHVPAMLQFSEPKW